MAPSPSNISRGIASTPNKDKRATERFHSLDTRAVCFDVEVEATKTVPTKRVSARLEDDSLRVVLLDHLGRDRLEEPLVLVIVNPVIDGDVQAVGFATVCRVLGTHLVNVACSWEEGPAMPVDTVFVEGKSEYTVSRFEGLLHAIAMMDIDVDVQYTLVLCQQELYRNDNVVDVAESRRQILLGVMQATGPVDGYVRLFIEEIVRCAHRGASIQGYVVP